MELNCEVACQQVGMDLLDGLHPAGISLKCEELFDKNGYAPLIKFFAMDGGEAAFAEVGHQRVHFARLRSQYLWPTEKTTLFVAFRSCQKIG